MMIRLLFTQTRHLKISLQQNKSKTNYSDYWGGKNNKKASVVHKGDTSRYHKMIPIQIVRNLIVGRKYIRLRSLIRIRLRWEHIRLRWEETY